MTVEVVTVDRSVGGIVELVHQLRQHFVKRLVRLDVEILSDGQELLHQIAYEAFFC